MAHPIAWIEISAQDRQQMADFYSGVFGWPYRHNEEMSYTSVETGDGSVGLGYNPTQNVAPGTVTVYIHTDDIADSINKVKAHGGEVLMDSTAIPTIDWMAMFKDPTGNIVGLLQPEPVPQS